MPVTLQAAKRAAARSLDDLAVYPVASATGSTVVSTRLVNGTASASTKLFDGRWAFVEKDDTTPQQRRVRPNGYAPSTGTLTIYPDWTANPTSADELEVTSLFPVIADVDAFTDYRTLINRALGLLLISDELAPSITTSDEYTLSATWLDREGRFGRCPHGRLDVREPNPANLSRTPVDACWRNWRFMRDGDIARLRVGVPFGTATGSITLGLLRPADTWIKPSGGAYADSAVGLVLDGDEAQVDLDEVLPIALMLAHEATSARQPGMPADPTARAKYEHYRDIAFSLARFDRTTFLESRPDEAEAVGRAA